MLILRLAWRNVGRHARRSAVTIAAMTLSLWVMVLYSGVGAGWMNGMERDILDFEVGDVQVHAQGYLDDPGLWTTLPEADAIVARIEASGLSAAPRLLSGGLAAHGEQSAGVRMQGVDPERERTVSRIPGAVEHGQWLDASDPLGIVIGRRLASTLGVGVGDEVILLSQDGDGGTANELFTVRGVLLGVSDGTDRAGFFVLASTFRQLMVPPDGAHEIIVHRPVQVSLDQALERVTRAAPNADVRTWRQLMPQIATMIDSASGMLTMVIFVVYVAVGILLLNAMLMAMFERIRELGVMKALGMGPVQVFLLIMAEVALQVGLSTTIAGVLALPTGWYLATYGVPIGALSGVSIMGLALDPTMKGLYTVQTVSSPVIVLLVVVLLAAVYPAVRAARLQPVDAMRHR